eukprot:1454905-Rhodomonas_salina.2
MSSYSPSTREHRTVGPQTTQYKRASRAIHDVADERGEAVRLALDDFQRLFNLLRNVSSRQDRLGQPRDSVQRRPQIVRELHRSTLCQGRRTWCRSAVASAGHGVGRPEQGGTWS